MKTLSVGVNQLTYACMRCSVLILMSACGGGGNSGSPVAVSLIQETPVCGPAPKSIATFRDELLGLGLSIEQMACGWADRGHTTAACNGVTTVIYLARIPGSQARLASSSRYAVVADFKLNVTTETVIDSSAVPGYFMFDCTVL